MTHKPTIWTGDVRRALYGRIVQKFGPYDTWGKRSSPGNSMDAEFDAFCVAFAQAFGAKSGQAVQHQIQFACPETANGTSWCRHVQTVILNKAAALESGFIKDSHLPNLYAVGRNGVTQATENSDSS